MSMQIDKFVELEKLNPISRMNYLQNYIEKEDVYYCNLILIALFLIDKNLKEKIVNSYSFYIQDDKSIKYLLERGLTKDIGDRKLQQAFIFLDISKLIYRFTCAKKFEIQNDMIKQVRLNSWGREFIESEKTLEKFSVEYNMINRFLSQYFEERKKEYIKLTSMLLDFPLNSDSVQIRKLNEGLNIKLLS